MKHSVTGIFGVLLVLVAMAGCSLVKRSSGTSRDSNPNAGPEKFLADFEKAVVTHQTNKLVVLMDADYKKEQLDDFLKGNTTQFLNEFFCGDKMDGSGFECLHYTEITSLKKVALIKEGDGYRVRYEVYSNKTGIRREWSITVKSNHGKLVYGLVGASG